MFTAAVGAFGRFGSAICLFVVATAFGTSDISLTSTGAVSISLTIETTQWVGDVNINPNNQITYLNCWGKLRRSKCQDEGVGAFSFTIFLYEDSTAASNLLVC